MGMSRLLLMTLLLLLPPPRIKQCLVSVVLSWDVRRSDVPRRTDEPALQVRADGTVTVRDPYGPGKQVEAQCSNVDSHLP